MVTQGGQLVARPIDGSGGYTNVLPSIIGTFNLRRNLIARAAWTGALGRPEFDALAPRAQLGIEDNPTHRHDRHAVDRQPRSEGAAVEQLRRLARVVLRRRARCCRLAAFRKNIRNEIIPAPTRQQFNYTFQGQTFNRFDINTTINAEKAHVQGVELTFAEQLRFLPSPLNGLGVGTSATFIGSGVKVARGSEVLMLPLLQQADRLTSLTLYYQRGRWDLSTTYKYNSNFLTDYGDSRALDLDQGGFGRWDCRAQFDLTPRSEVDLLGHQPQRRADDRVPGRHHERRSPSTNTPGGRCSSGSRPRVSRDDGAIALASSGVWRGLTVFGAPCRAGAARRRSFRSTSRRRSAISPRARCVCSRRRKPIRAWPPTRATSTPSTTR